MDIKIETKNIINSTDFKADLMHALEKKYGAYNFINSILINAHGTDDRNIHLGIELSPKKGKLIYVSEEGKLPALKTKIFKKLNGHIEKYKEVHYRSVHNTSKMNEGL